MITVMIIKANANDLKVMIGKRKTKRKGQEVEVLRNTATGIGAGVKINTKGAMSGTEEMTETMTGEKSPDTMMQDLRNKKTGPSGLTALHEKENYLRNLHWLKTRFLRLDWMEFP
jgi:hypothetical protein